MRRPGSNCKTAAPSCADVKTYIPSRLVTTGQVGWTYWFLAGETLVGPEAQKASAPSLADTSGLISVATTTCAPLRLRGLRRRLQWRQRRRRRGGRSTSDGSGGTIPNKGAVEARNQAELKPKVARKAKDLSPSLPNLTDLPRPSHRA